VEGSGAGGNGNNDNKYVHLDDDNLDTDELTDLDLPTD
jgi:hypothetical protein